MQGCVCGCRRCSWQHRRCAPAHNMPGTHERLQLLRQSGAWHRRCGVCGHIVAHHHQLHQHHQQQQPRQQRWQHDRRQCCWCSRQRKPAAVAPSCHPAAAAAADTAAQVTQACIAVDVTAAAPPPATSAAGGVSRAAFKGTLVRLPVHCLHQPVPLRGRAASDCGPEQDADRCVDVLCWQLVGS